MRTARFLLATFLVVSLPLAGVADVKPGTIQPFANTDMVAAANPLAAEAGLEMLRAGGSAVDAAIAVQMVLGLVEPESSGIGGGAFMLVYNPATKQTTSFDGREVAPASATPGMFLNAEGKPRSKPDAIPGGLSVGIPGVVGMLEMAHKKNGRLPWARLLQPAIKLADAGFPVGPKLARIIKGFSRGVDMPDIRAHFYHADGTPLAEGEIYTNAEYGQSLRLIAAGGAKAFYTGTIAQAIVDKVQHAPINQGGMTLADLAGFKALERPPVCGDYREWRLCSMGPPSSGGIAIVQILRHAAAVPLFAASAQYTQRSASFHPGQPPGLRRSRQICRRHRFRGCANRGPAGQGLYRQPRRADRSRQGYGHRPGRHPTAEAR